MDSLDAAVVEHLVSLKVCEQCGTLYCRRLDGAPYCLRCERELLSFPVIGSRKLRGRPPGRRERADEAVRQVE